MLPYVGNMEFGDYNSVEEPIAGVHQLHNMATVMIQMDVPDSITSLMTRDHRGLTATVFSITKSPVTSALPPVLVMQCLMAVPCFFCAPRCMLNYCFFTVCVHSANL